MAKLSDRPTGTPTAESYIHIMNGFPGDPESYKTTLPEAIKVGESASGTLENKSIDADNNLIRNLGFVEIEPTIISGAPDEATAEDDMEILVYDPDSGTLKKMSRLVWQTGISSAGENNTASNQGAGAQLFKQKTSTDLEFRTVVGQTDVLTVTQNADDITITAGAKLVKTNAANSVEPTFSISFPDNGLFVRNPGNTFAYKVRGSAITADRDVTLPLLTANDTLVLGAHAQALTNKTIDADSNTITNIGDDEVSTITTKAKLNTEIVYNDQANNMGANYMDFAEIAAPTAPAAGTRRLFLDSGTGQWSVKTSADAVVSLEAASSLQHIGRHLVTQVDASDQDTNLIISELTLTVEANTTYRIFGQLYLRAQTLGGLYGFIKPADATCRFYDRTTSTFQEADADTVTVSPAANPKVIDFHGDFISGPSGGILQLFLRQSATGGTLRLYVGSALYLFKAQT